MEQHPLLVFAPLALPSAIKPQMCPFFFLALHPDLLPFTPPHHVLLCLSSEPSSHVFFPPPPLSPSFPNSLSHSLPPSLHPLPRSSQLLLPHSISVPGHRCQQLERITANCATCGPLKGRKREEEGRAPCQMEVGFAVCARAHAQADARRGRRMLFSILDAATKHSV